MFVLGYIGVERVHLQQLQNLFAFPVTLKTPIRLHFDEGTARIPTSCIYLYFFPLKRGALRCFQMANRIILQLYTDQHMQ